MARSLRTLPAVAALLASAACFRPKPDPITEQELVRRTQQLFDATAAGDRRPFERYFAPDSTYFDEKGRSMDKKALVADQSPLPPGYSGSIKVVHPHSRILPGTAVLTYDLDETETVFGQNITARYHGTDTWVLRNGDWQIIAGQMLRYYEDPSHGRVDAGKLPDYLGTYELAPGKTLVVSVKAGNVFLQKTGRPVEALIPESGDVFFRKGVEGREVFRRNDHGRVIALVDRRNNEDIVWRRVAAKN